MIHFFFTQLSPLNPIFNKKIIARTIRQAPTLIFGHREPSLKWGTNWWFKIFLLNL